ncbi:MAG: nuclear transport factor 2 family protein [Chloroflexota bacterium]
MSSGIEKDSGDTTEADELRATERKRLRALVEADMETALRLHADDFHLVTPSGMSLSREQYLGNVASGAFNYLVWDPAPIEVRLYGDAAVIRYQSQLQIISRGQESPLGHYWHTDSYEKRDGRWQVVWSQATQID